MRSLVLFSIRAYQKILSLDTGLVGKLFPYRVCRFTPTCSQYTYEAVEKYGALKGLSFGIKRILRCHPAATGGYDPVR